MAAKRKSAYLSALSEQRENEKPPQETARPASQDADKPVSQDASKPVSQDASNPAHQLARKAFAQPDRKPGYQLADKPVSQDASNPAHQLAREKTSPPDTDAPPKLVKATYYIRADQDMDLDQVRWQRRLLGKKVDKSALVREALDQFLAKETSPGSGGAEAGE